ncbi:MAG TPA: alpha-L-fucosidase, partial [Blastocatellia bacterium]
MKHPQIALLISMVLLAGTVISTSAGGGALTGEINSYLTVSPPTALDGNPVSPVDETQAAHDRRMHWWREARFGMFIHWGLYCVPAGEYEGKRANQTAEWIMSWADIPRAKYEEFLPQFDPEKFNAAEWVRIARNAGMKYIVITSKHHEGFAMYGSKVSKYNIVDATPFHRDPMKELAAECKKQGIKFCFYYSIMDWHHPSQYVDAKGKDPTAGDGNNKIKAEAKAGYINYMKAQLKELVTGYDPAVLWFDGEWIGWWTPDDGQDLYNYVRSLKPDIIINNRVGKSRNGMQGMSKGGEQVGDFGTPEQQIPPSGLAGVDWESCMTMNDTWGYGKNDNNWKSARTIVRNLIDIASKGGNYLLNVGPTSEGLIPEPSVERLAEVGKWMKANGESIYGTSASPFASGLPFGRATTKGNKVYLQVFDWPADGELKVPAFGKQVKAAYPLAAPSSRLKISGGKDGITIDASG